MSLTDQEVKATQERIAVFAMKNLGEITKHAQLEGVGVTEDGKFKFLLVTNENLLKEWLKLFPEQRANIEAKIGKKLEI